MRCDSRGNRNDVVRLQGLAYCPESLFGRSGQPVSAADVDYLGHRLAFPAKICFEAVRETLGHARLRGRRVWLQDRRRAQRAVFRSKLEPRASRTLYERILRNEFLTRILSPSKWKTSQPSTSILAPSAPVARNVHSVTPRSPAMK